jgi:hypothetical protein
VNRRDVWVVQRRQQTRFPLEACDSLGIDSDRGRQDFHGDVTRKPAVARPIHFAHRARVERSYDPVWPEFEPWCQCWRGSARIGCGVSERGDRWSFGEPFCVGMRGQERFHFMSERCVFPTGLLEERPTLVRRAGERGVEDVFHARPAA